MQDAITLVNNGNINRVFFISDIHIKNNSTDHKIYYHVFKNLFNELKKRDVNKDDLIVITGDVLDSGREISPHAILMTKFFYSKLAKFCDTITILGNHDYKLDVDIITPIIKDRFKCKNTNHFLLDDQVYLYGNIAFGHTKFTSSTVTPCSKYKKKYTTIGLFHGIINGSKFDNDYIARSQFSMKDFKDYDFCAFGDLHKHQWLNKKCTAFYSGSLIQQKINEGPHHGIVQLDVLKGKCEFIEIQNDYKQLDITLDDNGNITNYDIDELAKNTKYADLRVSFGKGNDKMIENIKQQFNDSGITVTNYKKQPTFGLMKVNTEIKIGKKVHKLSNIKTKTDFCNFLYNYIISKHNITDKQNMKYHINDLISASLSESDLMEKKNIDILSIDVDNLMIFGENTQLNIESINGIMGVCQSNSFGKTTLCEMISLILHGKTPRCTTHNSFIRRGQTCGEGTVTLNVNDITYKIKRSIKRKTNSIYPIVTIEVENVNDNQIYSTDKKYESKNDNIYKYKDKDSIDKLIGNILTYDEIYNMLVVSQNRENSFLKNKEKINLLFNVSNLGYIDKVTDKCSTGLSQTKKNITQTIKQYVPEIFFNDINLKNNDSYCQYIDHIEQKIKIKEQEIQQNNVLDEYENMSKEYDNQKIEIAKYEEKLSTYNEFENMCEDVNEINENIKELNSEIKLNKNEINTIKKTQKENTKHINKNNKKLKSFGDIEYEHKKHEEDKHQQIQTYKSQINKHQKKIKHCNKIKTNVYEKSLMLVKTLPVEIDDLDIIINKLTHKLELYENPKNIFEQYKIYLELENEANAYKKTNEILKSVYSKTIPKVINEKMNEMKNKQHDLYSQIQKINEYKVNYDEYDPNEDIGYERNKLYEKKNNYVVNLKQHEINVMNYETNQENNKIQNEIKILEQNIIECENNKLENYDKYVELSLNNEKIQTQINNAEIKIEKLKIQNDKKSILVDKWAHSLNIIKENNDKYQKYIVLKEEYDKYLKSHMKLKKKYDALEIEKKRITSSNKKMEDQIIIANNILSKSKEEVNKIKNYEIIHDSLKNKGLYDVTLTKIVENLQNSITEMCDFIGHERINVNLVATTSKNKNANYNIVINTDKIPDIANSGGFQSNIIELLFKMAFLNINAYFKSDFIIIDEIFDACSEENKHMAIKLVEFFKMTYKKMLIVSHNLAIIDLFDRRLTIKYDDNNGNIIV